MSSRLIARTLTITMSAALATIPLAAQAETPTPSPTPSATMTPAVTPSGSASPTPDVASPSASDSSTAPSTSPTASASTAAPTPSRSETPASRRDRAAGAQPVTLTLAVTPRGTPQPGKYFEDIGAYAIRGTATGATAGTKVGVYWYAASLKQWHLSGTVTTSSTGSYAFDQPVGGYGSFGFRTTIGGVPGKAGVVSSNEVRPTVLNSTITQAKPVTSIDSLKNPTVAGSVYPARAGVKVVVQVLRSDHKYRTNVGATTDAKGKYQATMNYGTGTLASYSVRSAYPAANRPHWEISGAAPIKRTKVLSPVITSTTSAEVAKTYRSGCPVGPSKLRTIKMNYYGFDKRMHRGVLIVRTNLTDEITRSFQKALDAGYPIAKMKNPNDYGGNDPKQMAANNTSGFNCRKVVGNPYAQSPHSYGIAIDVNTVQNPYRDSKGKWWPTNGKSYIDRTPTRSGMLTYNSSLTKQLRKEGYFWGGLWSPGKDYQHFEYDK